MAGRGGVWGGRLGDHRGEDGSGPVGSGSVGKASPRGSSLRFGSEQGVTPSGPSHRSERTSPDATAPRGPFDRLRRRVHVFALQLFFGSVVARIILTAVMALVIWGLLMIPEAFGATITRDSSFAYDPSTGLLTKEIVEPGDTDFEVETVYARDGYGNITSTTVTGAGMAGRTSSSGYDAKGRFAASGTNALSQSESWEYDERFGLPLKHTGPNGLVTEWRYDEFGRVTREIRADGTVAHTGYYHCQAIGGTSSCGNKPGAVYNTLSYVKNSSGTVISPRVQTYYDIHGRVVMTLTERPDSPGGSSITYTMERTDYDAQGLVNRQSRPAVYGTSTANLVWMETDYDVLGRPVEVREPDGSGGFAATSYVYDGLTTVATLPDLAEDSHTRTKTIVKNERGEVVSVTDAIGGTVTYEYDPLGNRTKITDAVGNVVTAVFDRAGRRTQSTDPDMGQWSYSYNALGELESQTDARGVVTTMSYDALGRTVQSVVTEPGGDTVTTDWVYDQGTKGIGKLTSTEVTYDFATGWLAGASQVPLAYQSYAADGEWHTKRSYVYDSLGRLRDTVLEMEDTDAQGAASKTFTVVYDGNGRVDTVTYPSGLAVAYLYTAHGYLKELKNNATSASLWEVDSWDDEGRVATQTAGNGVVSTREFDPETGFLTRIKAGPAHATSGMAHYQYEFDVLGNLRMRRDNKQSPTLIETFDYDAIDRLVGYDIQGGTSKTVAYDLIGNITSKSDTGTYSYPATGQARPHAVSQISGAYNASYTYDANGNMTENGDWDVSWWGWNKIQSIERGTVTYAYLYGAGRERLVQDTTEGTTYYFAESVSGLFAERFEGETTGKWTDYLSAGGELIGMVVTPDADPAHERYFVTDHLGSVALIADENRVITDTLSYDAWGKRRYPNGTDDTHEGTIQSETTRGFTGHEMIDEAGLVNMNGRVYAPLIGRFLSPDPHIQDATNGQSLNRYTYVNNNPLSYTDPSGYFIKGLFKGIKKAFKAVVGFIKDFWRPLLAIAVSIALIHALPVAFPILGEGVIGPLAVHGIAGGVSNVIVTGKPKSFLVGFGRGVVSAGVGSFVGGAGASGIAGRALAHGVSGGAFAEVTGGDFGPGFLAGAAGSLGGEINVGESVWAGTAVASVTGGTASVLGGGKFADGAVTGAFAYLGNQAATGARENLRNSRSLSQEAFGSGLPAWQNTEIPAFMSDPYVTGELGRIWVYSLTSGFEQGAWIGLRSWLGRLFTGETYFVYQVIRTNFADPYSINMGMPPEGAIYHYHTHNFIERNGIEAYPYPSAQDIEFARRVKLPGVVRSFLGYHHYDGSSPTPAEFTGGR